MDIVRVRLAGIIFWVSLSFIWYSYFGYPIFLLLWTFWKKDKVAKSEIYPEVTLLIAAHNEETDIAQKLSNSLSLDYPRDKLQIVIASDGSTDATNQIVQDYEALGIRLYSYSPRQGKMSVLNKTMKHIDSEIVVFSDANVCYHQDAIKNLVSNFHDPSVGVVSGDAQFINDETSIEKAVTLYYCYERFLQRKETEFYSMVGAEGAIFAIRRDLFHPLPKDIILDDFVISMNVAKQGYRIAYESRAQAFESAPLTAKEEFRRKTRIVAGAVQSIKTGQGLPSGRDGKLLYSYVCHKVIRWLVPVLLPMLFLSNIFLMGQMFYDLVLAMQSLIVFLGAVGYWCRLSLFSIPHYLVLNNLAMLVGIYKGIFNRQSVCWAKFPRKRLNLLPNHYNYRA